MLNEFDIIEDFSTIELSQMDTIRLMNTTLSIGYVFSF